MQRPEELIAEVYRQLRIAREQGLKPEKVIMNPSLWAGIAEYRQSLGLIAGPVPDYLSEDGLFGLEIWYDNDPGIRVE